MVYRFYNRLNLLKLFFTLFKLTKAI